MAAGPHFEESNRLSAEQADSVRKALESIKSSNAFAGSKRCQEFLRLVVERALTGDLEGLRERMIGMELYGRPADYDTSNDAVVRVRATEVRKRLLQYYTESATKPVVRIELPPGSYVPEFHWSSVKNGTPKLSSPGSFRRSKWGLGAYAVAVIALLAVIGALIYIWRQRPAAGGPTIRLSLGLPQGVSLHRSWHPFEHIAISPDGQTIVFAATDSSGQNSLYLRPLASSEAQRIEQTEGALLPFWSPDSQSIGFWAGSKLRKIRRSGGVPEVICSVPEISQGTWGANGTILFAKAVNSPIFRVSAGGGAATPVTSLLPGQVSQMWVQFLPDGKHFIYLSRTSFTSNDPGARIYVQSLEGGGPTELLANQSRAIAVPDYLLFVQEQTLFAQRMDWDRLKKIGAPLLLARNVAASPAYLGTSEFAASQNGTLIMANSEGSSFDQFAWYARDGSVLSTFDPIVDFQQFTLSPDGKYLALNSFHQHVTGSMWLIDLASNTTTPLTTDPHAQSDPVWSPDSREIVFNLLPNGGTDPPFLVEKIELGSQQPQLVYGDNERHWVEDWSADGRFLLTHDTKTLSIIPLSGDIKPRAVYNSSFTKDAFHLSPDGRLVAYGEEREGRWDVFLAPFPSFRYTIQLSHAGGAQPRWRADGRELFFLDLEGKMMSVTIGRGPSPEIGAPRKLFETHLVPDPTINQYAVTRDGLKFLVLEPRKGFQETYSVILNWPETLK